MVVRRRMAGWASAIVPKATQRMKTRKTRRITLSFYFAHCHAGDDNGQGCKQQAAGHRADRPFVQEREKSGGLGVVGSAKQVLAVKRGIEDPGERAAGDDDVVEGNGGSSRGAAVNGGRAR